MTQEEKQLLLIDLCARLPYGVKYLVETDTTGNFEDYANGYTYEEILKNWAKWNNDSEIKSIKPYLRPISSMMQGEWEQMTALIYPYGRVNRNPENKNELLLWLSKDAYEMPIFLMEKVFSWLNKHHFDYRGLIEKGLALEAPEGMYKMA